MNDVVFYTLHLFSGAGGGILADVLQGIIPVGAVEINDFCRRVLLSRQFEGILPVFPIWDDVRTFRADNSATCSFFHFLREIRGLLCICAGFPCQDVSVAGSGAGLAGDRSGLFYEVSRIIGEVRPAHVFLENSPALCFRGLSKVLGTLSELGYDSRWGIIRASDSGAPHDRARFWCFSDSHSQHGEKSGLPFSTSEELFRPGELLRLVSSPGRYENFTETMQDEEAGLPCRRNKGLKFYGASESGMGGMVDGVADWLDRFESGSLWSSDELGISRLCDSDKYTTSRLVALGNGQVPASAFLAWRLLNFDY